MSSELSDGLISSGSSGSLPSSYNVYILYFTENDNTIGIIINYRHESVSVSLARHSFDKTNRYLLKGL